MSAPSPLLAAGSLSTFEIKSDGTKIDATIEVLSIDIWTAINKVPKARLVLFDGSPAKRDFDISNLATFIPGRKIVIDAGYDGKNAAIFTGIVVKQGIEIERNEGSKLIVDITDESIKMTLDRKNALYEKMSDGDLIGKLIGASGLAKDVASTATVHDEIVQYYATDWDLMVTRAELNGLVVMASAGKVTVKAPDSGQSAVLGVQYGESILDLRAEMNAATQISSSAITSYSWDPDAQKLNEAAPGAVSVTEQGNISSATLAKVFDVSKFPLQTGAPIDKGSLKDWSTAELLKSKLSKIRGHVSFQGSALAQVGKTIELGGLGERFNGTAFVSGIHHGITDGQWVTTAEFGLSAQWFAATAQRDRGARRFRANCPP